MTPRIRVLIADDHPMFRHGLRVALETEGDVDIVGESGSGSETVALCRELRPDVVVMDLRMPDGDGLDATRQITAEHTAGSIAVLTMIEDDDAIFAALRAGARGYILKGSSPVETLRAIRGIASGEAVFGPAVATRVLSFLSTETSLKNEAFPELTPRERDVLTLLASGAASATVARELGMHPKTVRNNVSNILAKLRVADRAQAIARAREAGLGRD